MVRLQVPLLVDVKHEVIRAWEVSSTKTGDNETLPALVEQAQRNLPRDRIQTLAYDKAGDEDVRMLVQRPHGGGAGQRPSEAVLGRRRRQHRRQEPAALRHSVCMDTMSPDGHFLVDRHPELPQVAFAAGLSGHGFKFAGVLGEALADLAIDGRTTLPIDFLSLNRLSRPNQRPP